jgi:hypothetical protein
VTATAAVPLEEQDRMFDAAEARLRGELGEVSIAKSLHARTREEAQQKWLAGISAFVGAMPRGSFVGGRVESGWPVIECAGSLIVKLKISEILGGESSDDSWRMPMTPDLIVVLVDAIGWRRWGSAWADGVEARVGESPARRPVPVSQPGGQGWMLDGPPGFASLLWFMDRGRVERAARALSAGRSAVNGLFLELNGNSDG